MDCPADTGAISQSLSTDEEYEIVPIDIDVSDIASQKLRISSRCSMMISLACS